MTGKRLITSLIQLIPLIVVVTIIFGVVGGYVNYFVLEPEYTATTTFYVMNPEAEEDSSYLSSLTHYEKLAQDYRVLATSRSVTNEVSRNLQLKGGLEGYEISVSAVNETRVMKLTVVGKDSEKAKEIADEMVKVFTDKVKSTIGAENVNVIDYAYVARTGPMRARNTVLVAIVGAILTVGIIVLKEFMDTTFRTAEEIENMLDLPVLAQVNRIKSTQSTKKKKVK